MNIPFLLAGALSALAALAHAIGGEVTSVRGLRSSALAQPHRRELRVAWHFYSVHLVASAAFLFAMARGLVPDLAPFLAVHFAACAVVFLACAARSPADLVRQPQWLLLFAIAALVFWGWR
jgi:hypothetical protein